MSSTVQRFPLGRVKRWIDPTNGAPAPLPPCAPELAKEVDCAVGDLIGAAWCQDEDAVQAAREDLCVRIACLLRGALFEARKSWKRAQVA